LNTIIIESFYKIYEVLKKVKEEGRDSIWKFIVQNLYKPYFLNKRFNYVIGNPPWFTYSSIKNEEYQGQLNQLAESYNVKPAKTANFPHLEIAAIFMSYCSSYFLKENGKIAFVLPRSFFNADHHDNIRSGKAKGFRLKQLWDLSEVSPLFRIPSSVLFGERAEVSKSIPASGIYGITFSGKLPAHNCNLSLASSSLTEETNKWHYIQQGNSSAFSTRKPKTTNKVNPYKALFRQGATIVPRTFYFIQLTQEVPDDWIDRIVNIKSSSAIEKDAKKPWKGMEFEGKIESNFLFRTVLSKNVLPFALLESELIVLPITIGLKQDNHKEIKIHSANELLKEGYRDAAKWFQSIENVWQNNRTELNRNISSENYLNWQNKLVDQNLDAKYLVLYNSSAKDANAVVVKRKDLDLEIIVESVTYVFYTDNLDEAYYLTAILNSATPNLMMKDFQSHGLFGARHVHKKILDIYYPKFDDKNAKHLRLAELSKLAHEKNSAFLQAVDTTKVVGIRLGKLRLDIKVHLKKEMLEVDKLVKKIIA
jgi:hypothetical protein